MLAYQKVFRRVELKFMITSEQKERIVEQMQPYMEMDEYGRTTIRNLYFDTPNYRLIRHSIEKPVYKEKLRIRSYGAATPDKKVFVELKKKYKKVVYKRRIALPYARAMSWLTGESPCSKENQISAEVDYFLSYYKDLKPVVHLSYEREAYYAKDGTDFRVTFDDTILCRDVNIALDTPTDGTRILEEGKVLMELKTSGGIPLWMTHVLTSEHIYKTSFSKYGTAYQTLIFPRIKESIQHA